MLLTRHFTVLAHKRRDHIQTGTLFLDIPVKVNSIEISLRGVCKCSCKEYSTVNEY